jgi:integrase
VTDDELARYKGVSLRVQTTIAKGDVVYVVYRDPLRGDRQTTKACGSSRHEVLAALDAAAQLVSECPPDALREPLTPFGDVAQRWFDFTAASRSMAPATLDNKASFYNAHLSEALGEVPIRDIDHALLVLLMRRLENGEVGANARSKTQSLLKNIFRWAKAEGYVYNDPTKNLEPVKVPPPNNRSDYLTLEEVRHLLDPRVLVSLEDKKLVRHATYYHVHLRFLVETGCRVGEMLAVRDTDLHLPDTAGESYVWIQHSRYRMQIKQPKTSAGNRRIPISQGLAKELRSHLAHRDDYRKAADQSIVARGGSPAAPISRDGLTFTSPWARPLDARQFRKVFRKVCAEAGIPSKGAEAATVAPHPHTLRHTFLTHLAETSPPQSAMMALAGHGDYRATQGYLGSTEEARRQAIGGLWARLGVSDSGSEPDDSSTK